MNPHRPNSQNTRPERMGRVYYFKTSVTALPPDVQQLILKDVPMLTKEEVARIRQFQNPVEFFYDMAERQGKNWDNSKTSKKELARAAKRLAKRTEETV